MVKQARSNIVRALISSTAMADGLQGILFAHKTATVLTMSVWKPASENVDQGECSDAHLMCEPMPAVLVVNVVFVVTGRWRLVIIPTKLSHATPSRKPANTSVK
jgi:hypothetical protein